VNIIGGADFNVRKHGSTHHFGMDPNSVDEDFIPFYDLKILAGRNFVKDDRPDGVVISRHATVRLGFNSPEEAVGARIDVETRTSAGWKEVVVLGVFENFRNQSFLNMSESSTESNVEGRGAVLMYQNQSFDKTHFVHDKISVRISPSSMEETLALIQRKYGEIFPEMVFTWYFLDQKINEVYNNEKIARNQIVLFTGLAIIIACLGLLGTITNKVVEKTKEIGIRKVLGAKLYQIANVLLTTTIKQIITAIVVGIPVAYYLTQLYLLKYSERISLEWWHFAAPILILVIVMFTTVASVLWKAARNSPVDSLKCE
jgi:putative ABC transport system permease protein